MAPVARVAGTGRAQCSPSCGAGATQAVFAGGFTPPVPSASRLIPPWPLVDRERRWAVKA